MRGSMWKPSRKKPGRDGRPLERTDEETLFRIAFPGDMREMRRAASGELTDGDPFHARWEAAVEIVRRVLSDPRSFPDPFRTASDAFDRYRYLVSDFPVEVFLAVLLDVKNRRMMDVGVSTGILNGSLIHPREVFAPALRERAASVLLIHNHPSGDPSPSAEDREVTKRLRAAGGIVGVGVLDHVIIGDGSFFSFREEGDW